MLRSRPRLFVVLPLLGVLSLAAVAAEPTRSVRWQDPAEGAFAASLPSGWQISGGTVRTTRIEPHYVIKAKSPDGGVEMFMDDPRLLVRQVPNALTQRMGMREGTAIPVTAQVWQPGGPVSLWFIYRIAGFLSAPQDSAAAAAAMHTMLGSFQMNQAWLQRLAQESGDIAGNVIRESNAVTQATIERARQQDATMAAQNAAWKRNSDATFNAINRTGQAITGSSGGSGGSTGNGHGYNAQLGTKRVCDDLDRCQTVDAAVDTWYSDCSGTFYPGTSSGGAPPASTSACWSKGH